MENVQNVKDNLEQGQSQNLINLMEQIRSYNNFVRQNNNLSTEQNEDSAQSSNKRIFIDNLGQNKKKR
jgi:hypothetical protein